MMCFRFGWCRSERSAFRSNSPHAQWVGLPIRVVSEPCTLPSADPLSCWKAIGRPRAHRATFPGSLSEPTGPRQPVPEAFRRGSWLHGSATPAQYNLPRKTSRPTAIDDVRQIGHEMMVRSMAFRKNLFRDFLSIVLVLLSWMDFRLHVSTHVLQRHACPQSAITCVAVSS